VKEEYGKRVILALAMSRLLPIKEELEILSNKLQTKFESPGIKLSTFTYEKLVLLLDKYGLYFVIKDILDNIDEEFEDISLLAEIEFILNFLKHYFVKNGISIEILQKIARKIFNYK